MTKIPTLPYIERIFLHLWEKDPDTDASSVAKYVKKCYNGRMVDKLVMVDDRERYEAEIHFANNEDATLFLLRWA